MPEKLGAETIDLQAGGAAPAPIATSPQLATPRDFRQDVKDIAGEAIGSSAAGARRELLEGTQNVGAAIGNRDFEKQLGFGNEAMLGAIEQRTRGKLAGRMRRFKHESSIDAYNRNTQKIAAASELVSRELEMNLRADAIRRAREAAKKRARGAVLGNILGIGGAVAGAAIGGPAGAAAGYQIGQGVGNTAGG